MSQEQENVSEKSIPPAGQDPKSISRRAFVGTVAAAGAAALAGSAPAGSKKAAGAKKAAEEAPVWSGTLGPAAGARKLSGLNIIVIIADTFRADHVGCYGSRRVKTPHLDKLAQQSVVFTNVTTEGLPTIPCRRVYHTGKSVLPESKWQPLAPGDTTFAQIAGRHGITTVQLSVSMEPKQGA